MKVKANVSFSGRISMAKGEKRDITDESLLRDLLAAGYVEEIVPKSKTMPLEQKKDGLEEAKTDPPDQKETEPEDEGK